MPAVGLRARTGLSRAGARRRTRSPVAVAGCAAAGIAVTELSLHLPSLDEVFLTLTGHAAEPSRPTT